MGAMEDFSANTDTSYDDTVTELAKDANGSSSTGATLGGIRFDPTPGFHTLVQDPATNLDRLNELFLFVTGSGLYFRQDNLGELAMVAARSPYVRGQVHGPLSLDAAILIAGNPCCQERGLEVSEEVLVAAVMPDVDCSLVDSELQAAFERSSLVFGGQSKAALLTQEAVLAILRSHRVKIQPYERKCFWCW